jgi:hypothetical protein
MGVTGGTAFHFGTAGVGNWALSLCHCHRLGQIVKDRNYLADNICRSMLSEFKRVVNDKAATQLSAEKQSQVSASRANLPSSLSLAKAFNS